MNETKTKCLTKYAEPTVSSSDLFDTTYVNHQRPNWLKYTRKNGGMKSSLW